MSDLQIAAIVASSLAVVASTFAARQMLSDATEAGEDARPLRRWHVPTWIATATLLAVHPFFF